MDSSGKIKYLNNDKLITSLNFLAVKSDQTFYFINDITGKVRFYSADSNMRQKNELVNATSLFAKYFEKIDSPTTRALNYIKLPSRTTNAFFTAIMPAAYKLFLIKDYNYIK